MESITDWLTKEGFTENQNTRVFEKGTIVIDFNALSGHTLDSFKELAKKKGWLEPQVHPMENIWCTDYSGYIPGVLFNNVKKGQPLFWGNFGNITNISEILKYKELINE